MRALVREIDSCEARAEALLRAWPDGRWFVARAGEITLTVGAAGAPDA